ncbi:MAG: DUF692 family protein [Bryobacteraceae bacterium]
MTDRAGLGWRPELAAGIFANLDRIDVIEVIADDYLRAGRREMDALRTLKGQAPVTLHSIGLGPASTVAVEQERLDALARLVGLAEPETWSEHLAFMRGGGVEIGHLSMPPRNGATVEGAAANLERLTRAVGTPPMVENIATLIDPPASDLTEAQWLAAILRASPCPLLLDLHNVVTNARNLGYEARELLDALPLERVSHVHIAGGRTLPEPGSPILDTHRHDTPAAVFDLLEELARRAPGPLTVVLERDGRYPPMEALVAELDRAREAMRAGRARSASSETAVT